MKFRLTNKPNRSLQSNFLTVRAVVQLPHAYVSYEHRFFENGKFEFNLWQGWKSISTKIHYHNQSMTLNNINLFRPTPVLISNLSIISRNSKNDVAIMKIIDYKTITRIFDNIRNKEKYTMAMIARHGIEYEI